MEKPVVKYRVDPELPTPPLMVGRRALVFPLNHTNHVPGQMVSNTKLALTSPIVSIGPEKGKFETMNTIYELE